MTDSWWKKSVVYQIYPRSFADADGDGMGDLRGVIDHLDHLAELGVDVLWLSPVYPSPQDDNGYDISDYQDIEPLFGTLEIFDELLAGAHARNMKIIMDLVVNHSSDEHRWFQESRSSTDSPKRDWYWWRPARPGMEPGAPGAEPTNWGSVFGGPSWEYDEKTGEYYLHLFSKKQPDLNWENPEVRQAVYAMMRWWLDRGVDGFRMDVINMISKDVSLPDGRLTAGSVYADGSASFIGGPRLHEFLQEMHREVFEGRDGLLTVGEMPGVTVDEAVLHTDPQRHEVDMVFQFDHVWVDRGPDPWLLVPLQLTALKAILGRWQAGLADVGWNSLYWNNHDQPRVVSRYGDDSPAHRSASAKMLGTVLHLHRGTPYVYQGEELGMTNYPFGGIDEFRDIEALGQYRQAVELEGRTPEEVLTVLRARGRDNARTPMQWDDSPHGGFTTGTPWLSVNPNHAEINAKAQRADPDSVFHYYRRLIQLRKTEPAVADGDFTMLLPHDERVYAFTRRLGSTELLVIGNFSGVEAHAAIDGWDGAELLLTNLEPPAGGLRLAPWQAVVYRRSV
ncbi:oligo-1,6-glucosidase [Actinoplanes campanulatus]|uniref:Oligo-1,6-glucosidase n=1 Tax=Actinoplanes campanulatus TaxID=113559 RepID=A0A7W5AB26_9ACTN|nr:alpha-glucosidase [Actinoplanes campanulatus]MBB3092705.1 oligo-1,6-glucosidase [Actinoplanes campanulatus]GGM98406.1 glucohydrolase [Actinoplanes campanulatus]GID34197.1 glucohydrolase [Actinoplanes campanulatus]